MTTDFEPVPALVARVLSCLSDDLLLPAYVTATGRSFRGAGHCYVACEALYHLGLRERGWVPTHVRHEGQSHWFLTNDDGEVVDPTAGQFSAPVPHREGRRCGFLTRWPSRRARVLIARVQEAQTK